MKPEAVIFDMDDVLCRYDLGRRLRALARITGQIPRDIRAAIWDSGFEDAADTGGYPDPDDYLQEFGKRLGFPLTRAQWVEARRESMQPWPDMLALAKSIGGQVRIATAVNGEGVDLSVSDTGPGIPLADRPRVIERFVRLEASRSSPGTGLGLSLVAAVAHYHGADLVLEDNTPTGLKAVLRFQKSTMRALPGAPLKSAAE